MSRRGKEMRAEVVVMDCAARRRIAVAGSQNEVESQLRDRRHQLVPMKRTDLIGAAKKLRMTSLTAATVSAAGAKSPFIKSGTARELSAITRENIGAVLASDARDSNRVDLLRYTSRFAAENAALCVFMMELRTQHVRRASGSEINLCRTGRTEHRPNEVDPQISPMMRRDGGSEGARRIHAHARNRRFDGDIDRDQDARAEPGKFVQPRCTGKPQHHGHENESDSHFSDQRRKGACGTRHRHDVVHGGMRSPARESDSCSDRAAQTADKLRAKIEHGVPFVYFAEAKER